MCCLVYIDYVLPALYVTFRKSKSIVHFYIQNIESTEIVWILMIFVW